MNPGVLDRWGDVQLHDRASGGYLNEVWYAKVHGRECVVRAGTRSPEALQWELDLMVAAAQVGIGVPEIIPATNGRLSVDGVVVFSRVHGERPASTADWTRVRGWLVDLHATFADRPQRPGFRSAMDLLTVDTGGLVNLTVMPDDAVATCRAAWLRLADIPTTVIHGDPNENNIFVTDDGPVLIDWDEARVDAPYFDLAALPDEVSPLSDEQRWVAKQAAGAWEAAISWQSDNEYARWRLSQVEPA